MENFQFWKEWSREYRYTFFFVLFLFGVSLSFFIVGVFSGIDFILGWNSISELTTTPIDYGKFTDYFHEFKIEAFNYLIYEKYTSPLLELQPSLAKLYLSLIFFLVILYLTFSTTLSKFLYYISIILFMLFLATLNLDLLDITTSYNKNILTIAILLFGGTSYGIYAFFNHFSLVKRFLVFTLLSAFFMICIYTLSPLNSTTIHYHLIGYSSSSLIVITILFIIYIAIENPLFISFLNSNSVNREKRGNLLLFITINVLYLLSLTIMYFYNKGFGGLTPFTLLISASVFTIWGTLKRNEGNTKGDTIARIVIMSIIGAISLSTIGYHSANGNSSLIKAFEREIMITFLCYGGLFFLYTIVNFIGEIQQKLQVYKVIFKPAKLSAYHMYVMGSIACLALFVKESKKPYYQAISGYYNSIADSYLIQNKYNLAETYYEFGRSSDPFNHRSNITVANLAIKKNDLDKAIVHYKYAITREPSVQSYIQLSNIYNQKGDYFDALFTLQEGIKKFPKSHQLYNNLGILSKKSDLNDSTTHYFSKAIEFTKEDKIPLNNYLTFLLKKGFNEEAKKLVDGIDELSLNKNIKTAISTYNAKNKIYNQWKINNFKADSILRNDELAYMFNHFINNINIMKKQHFLSVDTTHLSNSNVLNGEQLTLMKGFYEFYNGDPKIAREHLATLASSKSFYSGYYNNLLGLWLMLQKNYDLANNYFKVADKYNFQGAKFNHAFTLTVLNRIDEAKVLWNELLNNKNTNTIAASFLKILNSNIKIDDLSDYEKLLYSTFNFKVNFPLLINTVEDPKIKILIEIQQIKSLLTHQMYPEVLKYIESLEAEGQSIEFANNQLYLMKAEAMTKIGKNKHAIKILNSMDTPIEFKAKSLLITSQAFANIKEDKKATISFTNLTKQYPFYKDGLLEAAKYFRTQNKSLKAYDIIVDAIKVIEESPDLLKEYAFLCLDERLMDYGDETVIQLKSLMNKEEFARFNTEYQAQRSEIQKIFDEWEDSDS